MAKSTQRLSSTVASVPEKFGIMLVRLVVGAVFIMHGYQKWFTNGPSNTVKAFHEHFQMPPAAAYAAMTAEFACGILLVLGLFTRLAAIPIIVVMAVAILQVHLPHGFFAPMGYEYPLTLGIAALGLAFAGPGMVAADNLIA